MVVSVKFQSKNYHMLLFILNSYISYKHKIIVKYNC